MKKIITILTIVSVALITLISCSSDDGDTSTTAKVIATVNVENYGYIAGVNVQLTEVATDADVQEGVTNSEGKITFTNVLPGTYRLYGDYIINSGGNYEENIGSSSEFQLIEEQTKSISFTLN